MARTCKIILYTPTTRPAIIAVATLGGVFLNFTRLDPMRALLWSAEINGIMPATVVAMVATL